VPTYTYKCTACDDVTEKRQSFSDQPLTTCEQCGGALRKVIHPVGIVFKGSGWYITDSRSSSAAANGRTGSSSTDGDSGSKSSETSGAAAKEAGASSTTTTTSSSTSTSSSSKSESGSKSD
jgi:putative FmdB family regulatory protein